MFYFMLQPVMAYRFLLILAAVVPAIVLMAKVYRQARLDRQSPLLLRRMVTGGILAALFATLLERLGELFLVRYVPQSSIWYSILLNFVIVGLAEEGCKYAVMKYRSWNSMEFSSLYDGVVYAVFASLGFALWENIRYVLRYGLSTAFIRAITAIPGHACFGVIMGIFYGLAKKEDRFRSQNRSVFYQILAVAVPALVHGAYDWIASLYSGSLVFILFLVILFVIAWLLVDYAAKNDRYI
jgi:RsiW-degrading membrane proteinase PrsW (M82 family)